MCKLSEIQTQKKEVPPNMPTQLAKMKTRDFISEVLKPYRTHLEQFWDATYINGVETQHKVLVSKCSSDPVLKKTLDAHDHRTMFNDEWDDVKSGQDFSDLRNFVAVWLPHSPIRNLSKCNSPS